MSRFFSCANLGFDLSLRRLTKKKLSIVIVSKDTKDLLFGLLRSIFSDEDLSGSGTEVIVVDNGSKDGTGDLVREFFPDVVILENGENLGFAKAANRGFFASSGEYVLFLNSDTIVPKGEIKKMVQFMDQNPDISLLGPQLVYEDMRPQRSFSYIPGILFEIFPKSLLRIFLRSKFRDEKGRSLQPMDVESLIGAALLVRRRVFEELEGFDEEFFFFLEETDLCLRARKIGYRVLFFPDSKIVHLQGRTVKKNWIFGRIEYNISLYRFIRKHRSSIYFLSFVSVRFLKCLLALSVFTLLFPALLSQKMRQKYSYYSRLLLWHILGLPGNFGLRGRI